MKNAYLFLEFEHIFTAAFSNGQRVVAVTACNPGEGCSSLAIALARRHAAVGRRALLVDMNIYRPHLSGLHSLARHDWVPASRSLPAPQLHEPNLSILPAPTAADLSFREPAALRHLMTQLLEEHDVVVIDTAPLNAMNYANIPAENICASADACIMLVMANHTREEQLLQAREKLMRLRANLVGIVVNDYHNPSLADEITREVNRLTQRFPRLNAFIRRQVDAIAFLQGGSA